MAASPTTVEHRARPGGRFVGALVVAALALVLVAGCGSGSKPSLPGTSSTTTSTTEGSTSTTASRETTSTTAGRTTTITAAGTTTTTGVGPTSSTTSTVGPTTTTTTQPATTTTTRPSTTTTTAARTTTTTTAGTTTTTATGIASDTIASGESDVPWLALGALAALLVLVLVVALRRRSERKTWWTRAETLLHDGQAVVDLGTAGPAGADPQQEVAHWGTIEQRTQALANEVQVVLGAGPPDDASRAAVAGLGQALSDYLAALRTSRTLRIGPPAPTPQQLQYADAESNQRLAIVRANLDQLDQMITPHRSTA
ncbi:MAG: hypothetical protein ACXWCM_14255 [Acidimicrobiales bacterium]